MEGRSSAPTGLPDGYRSCAIGGTLLVSREDAFDAMVAALGTGTLHSWASAQPTKVAMQGRDVAWSVTLPGGMPVVVRHSRHGGVFAGLTRDLFLAPTRAPNELAISRRLRDAGVMTPEVIAYAVYSAAGPLCRADVVTERIDAVDLPSALNDAPAAERAEMGAAVRALLESLFRARAQHPDLNGRNILVGARGETRTAWVIDVDRVVFRADVEANLVIQNGSRLFSSMLKLARQEELKLTSAEIVSFMNQTGGSYIVSESSERKR